MNIPMFGLFLILFILNLPYAYLSWFKPIEFEKHIWVQRKKVKKSIFSQIYQPWIEVLARFPIIDITLAKIITIFFLLLSIVGMFIAIHGPIVI